MSLINLIFGISGDSSGNSTEEDLPCPDCGQLTPSGDPSRCLNCVPDDQLAPMDQFNLMGDDD